MMKLNGILVMMSVGLVVGACAPTTLSPNWGTAYQDMRAKQVLNPTAGEQLDPVEGQDGKVNATAMEAYRKNFEKPDAEFSKSAVTSGVLTK
ncbi:MAG: hypothetical protein KGS09_12025 [Nitrospirae bacterium]|nr:hypothetical protein [Nitrospirota bacterium]MDE3043183.1 hypothetical protein [Nitrospirota bacterium]MDE3221148.1 hypothetical protein [Nitrospirota bacterium]